MTAIKSMVIAMIAGRGLTRATVIMEIKVREAGTVSLLTSSSVALARVSMTQDRSDSTLVGSIVCRSDSTHWLETNNVQLFPAFSPSLSLLMNGQEDKIMNMPQKKQTQN